MYTTADSIPMAAVVLIQLFSSCQWVWCTWGNP